MPPSREAGLAFSTTTVMAQSCRRACRKNARIGATRAARTAMGAAASSIAERAQRPSFAAAGAIASAARRLAGSRTAAWVRAGPPAPRRHAPTSASIADTRATDAASRSTAAVRLHAQARPTAAAAGPRSVGETLTLPSTGALSHSASPRHAPTSASTADMQATGAVMPSIAVVPRRAERLPIAAAVDRTNAAPSSRPGRTAERCPFARRRPAAIKVTTAATQATGAATSSTAEAGWHALRRSTAAAAARTSAVEASS